MNDLEEAAAAAAGEGEGVVSLGVVSALGREDMSHMGAGSSGLTVSSILSFKVRVYYMQLFSGLTQLTVSG